MQLNMMFQVFTVLGFKRYYSALAENLVKMLRKLPSEYSINTFIKYYEHIQGNHFNLACVSKISTQHYYFKNNSRFKRSCLGKSIWAISKALFLSKPISDLCNILISFEKFLSLVKQLSLNHFATTELYLCHL